jgi:hypothetical protein
MPDVVSEDAQLVAAAMSTNAESQGAWFALIMRL